jgi:hypothetical protein
VLCDGPPLRRRTRLRITIAACLQMMTRFCRRGYNTIAAQGGPQGYGAKVVPKMSSKTLAQGEGCEIES